MTEKIYLIFVDYSTISYVTQVVWGIHCSIDAKILVSFIVDHKSVFTINSNQFNIRFWSSTSNITIEKVIRCYCWSCGSAVNGHEGQLFKIISNSIKIVDQFSKVEIRSS